MADDNTPTVEQTTSGPMVTRDPAAPLAVNDLEGYATPADIPAQGSTPTPAEVVFLVDHGVNANDGDPQTPNDALNLGGTEPQTKAVQAAPENKSVGGAPEQA